MSRNLYVMLKELLPDPPLLVGNVTASSEGVVLITVLGGATMQARGSATVGSDVFFRNGVVEGAAPTLTPVEIEI